MVNPGQKCAAASLLQALCATKAGRAALAACPELHAVSQQVERKSHAVDPVPLWEMLGMGEAQASAEEVLQLAAQRVTALGQAMRFRTKATTCCTGCGQVAVDEAS